MRPLFCLGLIPRGSSESSGRSGSQLTCNRGQQSADGFQRQANDIRWAARYQFEGQSLVLKTARPGFSLPQIASQIPINKLHGEPVHGEFAFHAAKKRIEFWALPEANTSQHSMPFSGER